MKTSGKILWISLAGIVAVLAILLGITKSIIGRSVDIEDVPVGNKTAVEISLDIDGFSGIEATGVWDVEIQKGNTYDVDITVPEYLRDHLNVKKSGDILKLSFKPGVRINLSSLDKLKARITMPDLTKIEISGGAKVEFDDFTGDSLKIESSGASSITGVSNTIENLTMESSGAVHVDLKKSRIKNLKIDLSGAGAVEVTMAGGDLSGSMSGAAVLEYWGDVASQTIDTSGVAKVVKN